MLYLENIEHRSLKLNDMNQSTPQYNFLAITCLFINVAACLLAAIISLGILLGIA